MNIAQLVEALTELVQQGLETHDKELTANDGQEITGVTVCTNMQTGEIVLNLELDDSGRLDLEQHPGYE